MELSIDNLILSSDYQSISVQTPNPFTGLSL